MRLYKSTFLHTTMNHEVALEKIKTSYTCFWNIFWF